MEEAGDLHDALVESDETLCNGQTYASLLRLDEDDLCAFLTRGIMNFYPSDGLQPFVPLSAKGPWIVTTHGALIYDAGGYGMTGHGHNPERLTKAAGHPEVMANVMTASFAQAELVGALRREIGRNWQGSVGRRLSSRYLDDEDTDLDNDAETHLDDDGPHHGLHRRTKPSRSQWTPPPYVSFACLNSGSEAVGLALRVTDVVARDAVQRGGRHAGKTPVFVALKGSFHGRTDRAARVSAASRDVYAGALASWMPRSPLSSAREAPECIFIEPNDARELRAAFGRCDAEGLFVEAVVLEPCMGEGDPGRLITRAFYDEARRLTAARGSMLVIDSVQAGLRATGELSVVDYPGFESCQPPDMEVFSKALNGGQYPLSVVAFGAAAAAAYKTGIYGNTMSFNPRAARVGVEALRGMTPRVRRNVAERGDELVSALETLVEKYPTHFERVEGAGLLVGLHAAPGVRVTGADGLEERCRTRGLNVVHGGANALRFTPWFRATSEEVSLVAEVVEEALLSYLRDEDDCVPPGCEPPDISQDEDEDDMIYATELTNNALANDARERKVAAARLVVDTVVDAYVKRNPKVAKTVAAVQAAVGGDADGGAAGLPLDHIAFRTFGVDGMGIASVANLFESLGYVEAAGERLGDGPLHFPEKKVTARWYRPPPASPPLPRVFISEIDVSALSPDARSVVEAYVDAANAPFLFSTDAASAAMPYNCPSDTARERGGMPRRRRQTNKTTKASSAREDVAGCHLRYPGAFAEEGFTPGKFDCVLGVIRDVYAVAGDLAAGVAYRMCCGGGVPWDAASVASEDYRLLAGESEYGAWTLMNGYDLNHVAIAVHRLPSGTLDTLARANALVAHAPALEDVELCVVVGEPEDDPAGVLDEVLDASEELIVNEECWSEHWEPFGDDGEFRRVARTISCPDDAVEDAGALAAAGFVPAVSTSAAVESVDRWSRVSPDGGLRQSSLVADLVPHQLFSETEDDFVTTLVPGAYLEFVERRSLAPEHAGVPPGELAESALRDGFWEGNAEKIFESTFDVHTRRAAEAEQQSPSRAVHDRSKTEKAKERRDERRSLRRNVVSRPTVVGTHCAYPRELTRTADDAEEDMRWSDRDFFAY